MVDLRVDPGQLEAFARQIGRAAEDSREVLGRTRDFTRISARNEGLMGSAIGHHTELRSGVLQALHRLSEILLCSSEELQESAAYYRRTDRAVAAAMDAVYPGEGAQL